MGRIYKRAVHSEEETYVGGCVGGIWEGATRELLKKAMRAAQRGTVATCHASKVGMFDDSVGRRRGHPALQSRESLCGSERGAWRTFLPSPLP